MKQLFVSDLDGTLLQPNATLSEYARLELSRLLGLGLPFTAASARSVNTIRPILRVLDIPLPVIEFNGAMATYLRSGERVFCHEIHGDLARAAAEAGAHAGTVPFVSTVGDTPESDGLYPPTELNDGMRAYYEDRRAAVDPRLRPPGGTEEALRRRVVCLTFLNRREFLEPLLDTVMRDFPGEFETHLMENWDDPGHWWLTLNNPSGTKALAVRRLAEDCGVSMERLTVFGDQVNDIAMFEEAGHAVAVENAIPELKAHADEVIGPNTSDSVVRWLAAHWPPNR